MNWFPIFLCGYSKSTESCQRVRSSATTHLEPAVRFPCLAAVAVRAHPTRRPATFKIRSDSSISVQLTLGLCGHPAPQNLWREREHSYSLVAFPSASLRGAKLTSNRRCGVGHAADAPPTGKKQTSLTLIVRATQCFACTRIQQQDIRHVNGTSFDPPAPWKRRPTERTNLNQDIDEASAVPLNCTNCRQRGFRNAACCCQSLRHEVSTHTNEQLDRHQAKQKLWARKLAAASMMGRGTDPYVVTT